ncbi:FTR1 family protein, partial [Paenibacillus alvei]
NAYNMWDAALIPIREGLEALLVIGSLLTIAKKTNEQKSSRWVWGGTVLGLAASLIIGLIVSYVLSASMFGQNNFVLAGVSGVFSSLMLLYVGYWLHSKSNIEKWNSMLQEKKREAVSGKIVSFALIAFFAVLREGLETVIFLIGLTGKLSTFELVSGLLTGFVILLIVGVLILKLGVRIPLKPFFLISTVIVLYMCLKFMGSGVHSLQLAGLIPSSISDHMPTISALGVFPSLYSTIPQLVIILFILGMLFIPKRNHSLSSREERSL